jgi:hypothetical protein
MFETGNRKKLVFSEGVGGSGSGGGGGGLPSLRSSLTCFVHTAPFSLV